CSMKSGAWIRKATSAPSMSTSTGCAPGSTTGRSLRSRPCGAWGTAPSERRGTMLNKLKHWLFTFNLTVLLVFNLFFIIVAVLAAVAAAVLIGSQLGLVDWTRLLTPAAVSILIYAIAILIGISMVVMIQKVILNPVRSMVGAMQRLATGDFSVRMTCQGWMRPLELREFTAAFNT